VVKIKDKMGQEWFDYLEKRRRIVRKLNKGYLLEVIEKLQNG